MTCRNVLFIAAEADPLIKKGGLGDVAGSLPLALKETRPELDIRLAIPHYNTIDPVFLVEHVTSFAIPSTGGPVIVDVSSTRLKGITVYLIGGEPIHAEEPVYVNDPGILGERFVFFSLACLNLPEQLDWSIDLLHANDWHTAVALHQLALLAKEEKRYRLVRSLLTIHNLPFMGAGSETALNKFMIPPADNPHMPEWSRTLPLPMGINTADGIVPVSEGYAREIMTPAFGCDLQDFLVAKKDRIHGIINGIDFSAWDPSSDPVIVKNYSISSLPDRAENKAALQAELSLPMNDSVPIFSVIGRLDRQKGMDIVIDAVKQLGRSNWQLVVLAYGNDETIRAGMTSLQHNFPDRVRFVDELNLPLSRRLYASADVLLMPSRYEPCGLAQMIAMHYGCVPVATATGGLKDTIRDCSVDQPDPTGFLSPTADAEAFSIQIKHAMAVFENKGFWHTVQAHGMNADFSWNNPAKAYLKLYDELCG